MAKRNRNRYSIKAPVQAKPSALVDIVIVVHNRFDLLEKCLDSIPDAIREIPYKVVLIDNNSFKEDSIPFYAKRPDAIVIENKENVGFPRACNQGTKRSNSPLIFFLNSDVILEPGSLNHLIKQLDDPKIGVAGMLLKFPEYLDGLNPDIRPAGKVQHVGLETNIHGRWLHAFVGWSADHPKVLARRNVYAVTGAALLTRRSIWNKVGGFLEDYGLGTFEDCDYCMSVRELGYNIIVDVDAVGVHYTGATAEKYGIPYALDQNRFIFLRNWSQRLQWTEWTCW